MNPELIPLLPQIKTLIEGHVVNGTDTEKRHQFAEARRIDAYWKGNQYVIPVFQDQQIVDWRSATGALRFTNQPAEGAYDYVQNQIRGDGKKFVAVLGQRSPNVKALANKLDDEQSVRVADQINDMLGRLRALWDVERVQRRLALSLWKNGTTFGHVRWVANGFKYGWTGEPQYEMVDTPDGPGQYQCSACGAVSPEMGLCPGCGKFLQPEEFQPPQTIQTAQPGEPVQYPKGAPELTLETIFRVTTPFYASGVETLPWLWLEYEEHQAVILSAYADGQHDYAAAKLVELQRSAAEGQGTALSVMGQSARDAASNPQSRIVGRPDRWLYQQFWLVPAMYMYIQDEAQRREIAQTFPDGLKATMVGGEVIDLENKPLVEDWAVCFPEPNESMYPDPVCKDYIAIQDLINDALNITVETAERAIPMTYYDPTILNKQYLKEHAPAPGEMIPAVPGVGKRLSDSVWTSPTADINAQLFQWGDALVSKARENVGILPALFGGEGPVQTAYQASRQLNQALMQLSPVWNEMRSFWKQAYSNGLRHLIKNDPELAGIPMQGWHLEVEEAIPMSWGQIRDFFALLLDKGPEAWQMFGLNDPANLSIVHTALGLHGWTIRDQKEREHILDTIRQLLKEPPVQIPAPIDPMTGMEMGPPQIQSSLPPDDMEFTPPLVVQVVREWFQERDAQEAKQLMPEGYANVLAWVRSYAMMMAPPMPGGPDGGPGPGGPPSAGGEPPPAGADTGNPEPPPPPSVTREPLPGPETPLPRQ